MEATESNENRYLPAKRALLFDAGPYIRVRVKKVPAGAR